jgi:extradiol dioxygenase family protein
MKDTDFNIKFDKELNQTIIYLPEFGVLLDFDDNAVYVSELGNRDINYSDYEQDLSPILHWINHMYNVDGMRETLTNPAGLSGNTKTFRRVYNQLMKETNAYKLDGVSVIADTE